MSDKPVSDLTTPNFTLLYHEAIKRLHRDGLVPFSPLEAAMVGVIVGWEKNANRDFPGIGDRLTHEVDFCMVPKYVALISWLHPLGPCSHHPQLVWRLARYLLGYTKLAEEAEIPDVVKTALGV